MGRPGASNVPESGTSLAKKAVFASNLHYFGTLLALRSTRAASGSGLFVPGSQRIVIVKRISDICSDETIIAMYACGGGIDVCGLQQA